uniref:Uncharacterized protein n=1 Tax=Rhipicephalus microplus TaxID=6941 RepID=A0A6G5AFD4_RHIMP
MVLFLCARHTKLSFFFFFFYFSPLSADFLCKRSLSCARVCVCVCVRVCVCVCVCFNVWLLSLMMLVNVSHRTEHAIFDSTPLCCRFPRCFSSFLCEKVSCVTDRLPSLYTAGF